jgi:hypothetical protein
MTRSYALSALLLHSIRLPAMLAASRRSLEITQPQEMDGENVLMQQEAIARYE